MPACGTDLSQIRTLSVLSWAGGLTPLQVGQQVGQVPLVEILEEANPAQGLGDENQKGSSLEVSGGLASSRLTRVSKHSPQRQQRKTYGAEGGTRTPTGCPTTPSRWRVCQFHHFGTGKVQNRTGRARD